MPLVYVFLLGLTVLVLGIVWSAGRAARAGRRYKYSGDAVERYRRGYSPYFGYLPVGPSRSADWREAPVTRRTRGQTAMHPKRFREREARSRTHG